MIGILSIEYALIDFMSMFYPYYFFVKKIKINLLLSPKVDGLAKIRGLIRSFHDILSEDCATPSFEGNWNTVCSVYYAPLYIQSRNKIHRI